MILPTILTEDVWFYEANKEVCKPHLGKPYLSYSSVDSWNNYFEEFVKGRIVGLPRESNIYAEMGSYLGTAVETGKFPPNEHGFTGQENFDLIPRPDGAEYERFVLIDFGDFVFVGFIDMLYEVEGGYAVRDLKSGGKNKEEYYAGPEYLQVPLYAYALEKEGYKVVDTNVWFVRRTGSHVNPPLNISDEQFEIKIPYTKKRGQEAVKVVKKAAKEISSIYTTYKKIFE